MSRREKIQAAISLRHKQVGSFYAVLSPAGAVHAAGVLVAQ